MTDEYTITVRFKRTMKEDHDLLLDIRQKAVPMPTWAGAARRGLETELNRAKRAGGLNGDFEITDCDLLYGEDAEADAKFKEMFPEVTRWGEVADDARTLFEFLDWLEGEGLRDLYKGDMSAKKLVYEFFEISEDKLEDDRHRLYEALRKNPWPVVVVEKKEG